MNESTIKKPADVQLGVATRVLTDWLKLDHMNPRLGGVSGNFADEDIVVQLYKSEDLSELLQSIAANGYMDIEPLIVELDDEDEKFIVLEGNRRLAAIRLFQDAGLSAAISGKFSIKLDIPEISQEAKNTLSEVSVYRVEYRDAARSFIGFKHINGAAKWESYAKARFVAEWYKSGGTTLEEIADKIGDRHDTIKRMVTAIYVLDQAEETGIFSISNRKATRFNFSHMYTALSRSQYRKYLGLQYSWSSYDPQPDPVPGEKLDQLGEIFVWLYGSKEDDKKPIVLSQNPDIKRLGETLANPQGVHVLRAGGSLNEAHASTRSAEETFSSSLIRARKALIEAVSSMRGYDGRDQSLLDFAKDVLENSKTILERMMSKNRDVAGDNDED